MLMTAELPVVPYPEVGAGAFTEPKQKKGQLANAMSEMLQRQLYSLFHTICGSSAQQTRKLALTNRMVLHDTIIETKVTFELRCDEVEVD